MNDKEIKRTLNKGQEEERRERNCHGDSDKNIDNDSPLMYFIKVLSTFPKFSFSFFKIFIHTKWQLACIRCTRWRLDTCVHYDWASQVAQVAKISPANTGDIRDMVSIPGSERSPWGGHCNPLQYFAWRIPMDRGAWQTTVHGVSKSWAWLKWLRTHCDMITT